MWENTCVPSTASMRLPVWMTRYWRTQVITAENIMNIASAKPTTIKVLWVWCTITLSMIAWVNSGVASAIN